MDAAIHKVICAFYDFKGTNGTGHQDILNEYKDYHLLYAIEHTHTCNMYYCMVIRQEHPQ